MEQKRAKYKASEDSGRAEYISTQNINNMNIDYDCKIKCIVYSQLSLRGLSGLQIIRAS